MTIGQDHKQASFSSSMLRLIYGSFIPNGSDPIVTTYGRGFTVARAGTGNYTVTLEKPFADFVSIQVTPQFASSNVDPHIVRVGDIDVAARTFEILHTTSTDVSATDLAAADISTSGVANKIHFVCAVATADVAGAGV